MNGRPATACDRSRDSMRPATAPATACDKKSGDRTTAATSPAILRSPPSTPDRSVAQYFSQGVFSENFLHRFSGGNSQRKIQLEGWGVQIPVQIFENFSVCPMGLSNRRAMIPRSYDVRLLQSLQRRFNGTSITIVVIGARSGRMVLSEFRRSVFPVLPSSGVNASCVAVLCVSSVRVLLYHRLKFRRSASSSSSIS